MRKVYIVRAIVLTLLFAAGLMASAKNSEKAKTSLFIDKAVIGLNISKLPETNVFQLISHGRPGELLLDGSWKNAAEIAAFLKEKLTRKVTHINIYGCEFAKGEKGLGAVNYLQKSLGVSISASTNITGKGGDWVLEVGTNIDVINMPAYTGNLQCTYGVVYVQQEYATVSSGGYTPSKSGNGVGAPDGVSMDIYNTSGNNMQGNGIFTYPTSFSAGSIIEITGRYIDGRQGGVGIEFSTNGTTFVGLNSPLLTGWNGSGGDYKTVKYVVPSTLTGAYKYIRLSGSGDNTYINVDAVNVQIASCNTCPSGKVAPILSKTYIATPCPGRTVNLTSITASNLPANTIMTWHTSTPATDANKIATPTAAPINAYYYAAFYNASNNCYSGINGDGTAFTQVYADGDNDCDGVFNKADLDDDNDGILDVNEGLGDCNIAGKSFIQYTGIANYEFVKITNAASLPTNTYIFESGGQEWGGGGLPSTYDGTLANTGYNAAFNWFDGDNDNKGNGLHYDFSGTATSGVTTFMLLNDHNWPNQNDGIKNFTIVLRDPGNAILGSESFIAANQEPYQLFTLSKEYKNVKSFDLIIQTTYTRAPIEFREVALGGLNLTVCGGASADTDGDGIPDFFDLDSDGDGCADALEGGANFNYGSLQNSNMPGGNTGVGYTGTSNKPVIYNLGNVVDANGVPVIANGGQSVGTSAIAAQQDAACNLSPSYTPDNETVYVNTLLNGDVSANDNRLPGTLYSNPPANPSNPSACMPSIAANGTYTFICGTAGVYVFQLPVCEPNPSTTCTTVPLTITVTSTTACGGVPGGMQPNDDFDKDGICNKDDIDDDNDGVLNAVESPNCYYTLADLAVITSVSSTLPISHPTFVLNNTIDGDPNTYVQYDAPAASGAAGKDYFQINMTMPLTISSLQLLMGPYYALSASATSNTLMLQGFDGTNWLDLEDAATARTTNVGTITITNTKYPNTKFSSFRLRIISGKSYYANIEEITVVPNGQPSQYLKPNCITDTDGDGIPNQFDLDSDGDGCSDAIEGGVKGTLIAGNVINGTPNTTTVLGNAIAQGPYGTNGLANTIETDDGGAARITYNSTYTNYAVTKAVNACTDTDGDGIPDVIDLDDDNDGILDTDECNVSGSVLNFVSPQNNGNNTYTGSGLGYTYTATDVITATTDGGFVTISGNTSTRTQIHVVFDKPTTVRIKTGTSGSVMNGTSATTEDTHTLLADAGAWGWQKSDSLFQIDDRDFTIAPLKYPVGGLGTNNYTFGLWANSGTATTKGSGFVAPSDPRWKWMLTNQNVKDLIITNVGDGAWSGLQILVDIPTSVCDLDGDGIPNTLDLDSDGDGCPDAIEGGGGFTSANLVNSGMPGGNSGVGYNGSSTSPIKTNLGNTVDNNGVPTIANGGQTVGYSQSASQQSPGCTPVSVHNPDFNVTYVNVPVPGNVSTNDKSTPGSTYGTPAPNPKNPSDCMPVMNPDGSGKYTFTCDSVGKYVFMVPVCEPSPSTLCTTVPLTITVLDPNDSKSAPIANPDYGVTKVNTPDTLQVLSNDKCQNGPNCTLSTPTVVTNPKNGTFDPIKGIYTPAINFVGLDSLQYSTCDNQSPSKCDTAWVYITVLPVAVPNTTSATDDYVQTPYATPVNGNAKTNDKDPDGNFQIVTPQTTTIAGKGTLKLNADGTFTFTPAQGFSGPVEFPYTTCDTISANKACATATIHVLVEPMIPTHNPDINVTHKDVPVDGDVSTNDKPTPGTTYGNPPVNPKNPSDCMPVMNPDGSGKYTFVCDSIGTYIFNVPVCEPGGAICRDVPLTITVLEKNNPTQGPVANPDYGTTKVNTPITIPVVANDKCENGPTCTLGTPGVVTGPKHGTFDPVTNIYTPTTGFVGNDTLLYSVCDNQVPSKCDSALVYIKVIPANTPNSTTAADDYVQTPYNTPVNGNAKTNDSDPEKDAQNVTPQTTTVTGKGTLKLNADGTFTFTPASGFTGPVSFPYTTCDTVSAPNTACATATIHVLVDPQTPTHNPDINVTHKDVPVDGDVSTNDKPTSGTTYGNPPVNPKNPSDCMPVMNADGSGKYTFVCDSIGTYIFNVPVCEPGGAICRDVPLTITVLEKNNPAQGPVANPDYGTTKVNTPITIPVVVNDKCENGPTCTLGTPSVVTNPKHGTFDPVTNVYTPTTGFVGNDTLLYSVCDNQVPSKCDSALVYIKVIPANTPNSTTAADDYVQTPYNTPVTGNAKTNDSDPEKDAQNVTPQTTTVTGKGTLKLNADGTFTFTPASGFTGPVSFPYTTCDTVSAPNTACASATIHVLVDPQTPTHNPDINVTHKDVPVDGDVSTNDKPTPGTTYGNPPVNPKNPSDCMPVMNPDGSGKYTFVCDSIGTYIFNVPVCEPGGTICKDVPLTITVLEKNNPAQGPVANPDYGTTKVNTPITIPVVANDKCENGPTCTLGTPSVVTGPKHGTFDPVTNVYTPTTGFVGNDTLLYSVCDNQVPSKCDSALVYIKVIPAYTPNSTTAADDYVQTPFGTPVNGNAKTNDSDPEKDAQNVTPQTTTVAGKGTLVLNADGTFTFTPASGFTGPVSFPYTTCDTVSAPNTACASATIHVLVDPQDPVYNPDFGVTYKNVPLTGNVSTNDKPLPGTTSYSNPAPNPSNPSDCLPTINADGTYSFVCDSIGKYTFAVPVCGSAGCTTVLLQITVLDSIPTGNPADSTKPVANPDYVTTMVNKPVTLQVTTNDRCENGPTCTLGTPTVVTMPKNGQFDAVTGIYKPNINFVGVDSFQYSVCDNQATPKCATTWAYITVLPLGVPNSTSAADDYVQTPYNTPVSNNVKTNDTDSQGDLQNVTPQTTTITNKGTIALKSDGSFTFTPVIGFSGPVDFPYTTCDTVSAPNTACANATIHILVELPLPDLSPFIYFGDDDNRYMSKGQTREIMVVIRNVGEGPTTDSFVYSIPKFISLNSGLTTEVSQNTSFTVLGTVVNFDNASVSIRDGGNVFYLTSKPGVVLRPGQSLNIGFKITDIKATSGSKIISATVVSGTGGGETPYENDTKSFKLFTQ